jgi:hypothetical protein
MKAGKRRTFRSIVFWAPSVGLVAVLAMILIPLFGLGYVQAMLSGPEVVMEVSSPDGEFVAYVEEPPSLDPPNQSLFVERGDKTHFMRIAKLAGDVDSIKDIVWSEDGDIVVFHSQCYLTAARVADWRTTRVYLGREWRRAEPKRRTTFSSGGAAKVVDSIEFPEAGVVEYMFEGESAPRRIQFTEPAR